MNTKSSGRRWHLLIAILAIAIVALSIYAYALSRMSPPAKVQTDFGEETAQLFYGDNTAYLDLPAISSNDTGVSARLSVHVAPGSGNLYFGIHNSLSSSDTQHSARIAALYAAGHEKVSLESIDLTYNIRAEASVIEGPSAGAAMAVATIAALRNKSIGSDAMITGTINHDGTIGPSGRIIEKARAAKEAGAKVFLVPLGSISEYGVNYTEQEFCHLWGIYEYCQPEFVPSLLDVSKEAGIPIIEVADIDEALEYFIN